MRRLTDGFRQPKRGRWRLGWAPFHSPLPGVPHFRIPWKALGTLVLFSVLGFLLPYEWAALYFLPLFGMAQLPIAYGTTANDGTGTNWRTAFQRIQDNFTDLYALQSRIVSAGDVRFASEATTEAKIDAACTQAEAELKTIVAIPAIMLPYDTSLVGAHPTIRRVREGGDYGVYDVRAYGADPDGVIAATTAFNAIPTSVETFVSEGTYLIDGTITKKRMRGVGPASVLLLKASASLTSFQSPGTEAVLPIVTNPTHTGPDDTDIVFQNFRIDGNSANQSHDQGMAGIYLRNVDGADIINVTIEDIVPDSMVTYSKQSFCFLAIESTDIHLRGGDYSASGYECIGFRNEVTHSSIVGVRSGSGGVHSIQVACGTDFGVTATNKPSDISIVGCTIRHLDGREQGAGLIVHTGDYVTMSGNTIYSQVVGDAITSNGMILDACTGCVVSGNTVKSAGGAIHFRNSPNNCTVTGNYFQGFITGRTQVGEAVVFNQTSSGTPTNIDFVGNTVVPATNRIAIWVRLGLKLNISKNVIPQTLRGIYVDGAGSLTSDITVDGNEITATGTAFGIQVVANASHVRVRNNTLRGTTANSTGITVESTASNVRLEGNDLQGISDATKQIVISSSGAGITRHRNKLSAGASVGQAVLVNGTVTVNTVEVRAADSIQLTRVVGTGTTRGILEVGTITAGTSFVINAMDLAGSLSADDDSTIAWEIVH